MTYTGKPSSACRTCRQRRIRCDEGRPTCAQCKKARRECLGYPDPDALVFQNQTNAVIQRAKRIHDASTKRVVQNKSSDSSLLSSPASSSNWPGGNNPTATVPDVSIRCNSPVSFQSSLDAALMSIIPNPPIPIETRALEFFLTAQLLEPMSRGRIVGHLTFLPPLFSNSLSTSALSKVTTAAAVASFDLVGNESAVIKSSAYSCYGDAVRTLAEAMNDPRQRIRNETLLACVLMIVVESMLARESSPQRQWTAHVLGASNLLRERGRTDVGGDLVARRIWSVVRGFMMQNPANRLSEDDLFGPELPSNDIDEAGPPPPEVKLGMLSLAAVKLRDHALHVLTYQSHQSEILQGVINACQSTDNALCSWALNLPQSYQFSYVARSRCPSAEDVSKSSVINTAGSEWCHDGVSGEHHYPDPHLQRIWNSYRTARIMLNAMIYRATTSSDSLGPHSTDMAISSAQTLQELAVDILSSVSATVLDPKRTLSRNAVSAAGEIALAYYCLWPLYIARSVVILPQTTKLEIVDKMSRLVDKYGIRHGKVLVDVGSAQDNRPLWGKPWPDGWIESNWQWAFLYGCGAV